MREKKIEQNQADWPDYAHFLRLGPEEADPFFRLSRVLTEKHTDSVLRVFTPGEKFPAVSVTGEKCSMACEHCNHKYLKGMVPTESNTDLEAFLRKHHDEGGLGVLISGGNTAEGSVPLDGFLETVKKVKQQTGLYINVHTGLVTETTARQLADAGVDAVSFDVNMDQKAVNNIYRLDRDLSDYRKSMELLKKHGLNIIPHVCIGLFYGRLHRELDSIRFIKDSGMDPSLIVFIALVPPTVKPEEQKFSTPTAFDIAKIIAVTRFIFPDRELSLGCLRPKGKNRHEIERSAIRAGANRIVLPTNETLDWVRKEYPDMEIRQYEACCVVTDDLERFHCHSPRRRGIQEE